MKTMKLVISLVLVLSLSALSALPAFAEDGVDWEMLDLEYFEVQLQEYLGYRPVVELNLNQKYGELTILLPEGAHPQRMIKSEDGELWMSATDLKLLFHGELRGNVSPLKGKVFVFHSVDNSDEFVSSLEDVSIMLTDSGNPILKYWQEYEPAYTIPSWYDTNWDEDFIVVRGEEIAQLMYDCWVRE